MTGVSIIGLETLSEELGCLNKKPNDAYATTYDPVSVFALRSEKQARYSREASESYNREHYVWGGPRFNEKLLVFHNVKGHKPLFLGPASDEKKWLPVCHE